MPQNLNYTIERGEVWERLILVKDRRTRRVRKPSAAACTILIDSVAYDLPLTLTSEGGILLSLNPAQTKWLVAGEYAWDGVAVISRAQNMTTSPSAETVILKGTLTVTSYDPITPMAVDLVPAEPLIPVA